MVAPEHHNADYWCPDCEEETHEPALYSAVSSSSFREYEQGGFALLEDLALYEVWVTSCCEDLIPEDKPGTRDHEYYSCSSCYGTHEEESDAILCCVYLCSGRNVEHCDCELLEVGSTHPTASGLSIVDAVGTPFWICITCHEHSDDTLNIVNHVCLSRKVPTDNASESWAEAFAEKGGSAFDPNCEICTNNCCALHQTHQNPHTEICTTSN